MDPAPEVFTSNTMMRSKVFIRSGQMIISPCGVIESSEEHEFSCKFDDAQWKKILQKLKKFFRTSKDVFSKGQQSFEKEKKKKVQESHAWAKESELTKESKVNLVGQSFLIRTS